MARNVEIKAQVEDINSLKKSLLRFADREPVEIIQDDTFFSCRNGRLKLRRFSDMRGELIFYQRADDKGPKESFYLISKTQEPGVLRDLLANAYDVVGRVQKHRFLYFKGRTRIHLDKVKGLGDFIELEVVLKNEEPLEDGVREANRILSKLDIDGSQLIEGAYVDLLASRNS